MERILKTISHKAGMPPGSLVHIGEMPVGDITVRALRYTESELEVIEAPDKDALLLLKDKEGVVWVQVDGVHQPEKISAIGEAFSLHSLTLEDILNTGQRSKMDLVGAAFGQRRKMLRSSLKTLGSDSMPLLEQAGIDPTARAEDLLPLP